MCDKGSLGLAVRIKSENESKKQMSVVMRTEKWFWRGGCLCCVC